MTARVRVHLLTYKRPKLLGRALKSLLAQTLQDWTCELHNDAPDDPSPGELCQLINDPRIHYVPHERNLGPTATFNLLFKDAYTARVPHPHGVRVGKEATRSSSSLFYFCDCFRAASNSSPGFHVIGGCVSDT